jgi:large subunit ribosomal protein L1
MKVDDKLLKRSLNAALDYSVLKKEGLKSKERKFDETIDLILNIKDINLQDPNSRIDRELILPNNVITDEKPNICVIASDEILLEAKNLGLDTLDGEGLIQLNNQEKKSKKKFVKKYNFFIVDDKEMRNVARYLARFLGPAGKMPKPFPSGYGIISSVEDLKTAVDRYKKVVRVQMKKNPIIQMKVGKKSMSSNKILENMKAAVDFILDFLPHKYNNIKSIIIKTTMGKSIKVDNDYLTNLGV